MTAPHVPPNPTDDLLARLGLPPSATSEEVEAAHAAVVEYLATAPAAIRGWAHAQAASADEALLLLTDPAASARPTLSGSPKPVATRPDGPAAPPVRRATPAPDRVAAPETADDAVDELELLAAVTPSMHRDEVPSARKAKRVAAPSAPVAAPAAPPSAPRRVPGAVRNLAIVAVLGVGVVTIAAVGYGMGGGGTQAPDATPPPAAAQPSGPALDQEAVAGLMERIQADPSDTEALIGLADEFYAVGQWQSAQTWLDKLLEIEPDNIRALLAIGATSFNLGDFEGAEARWQRVVEIDADNLEAHYDLGFLYLSQDPPDLEAVAREWGRVVEIDPESQLAKTVSQHLTALLPSAAPSGGPAASPGASPDASPAASPAPSAAPSVSPAP